MGRSLVTGASGFIGRALVRHLLDQGEEVIALARQPGPAAPGLRWHRQDLLAEPALPGALLQGLDRLFLLAAQAHRPPPQDPEGQARLHRLNVEHPALAARAAAATGVGRLVFLSSIGAQGSRATLEAPLRPNQTCYPATAYGASKRAAEEAIAAAGPAHVILRPPLVVGPGAPGNLARLARRARAGGWMPQGTLKNHRSLVGLTGLVEALALAGRHPEAAGQTFLVAEAPPLSTGALYRQLAAAAGQRPRFLPFPSALTAWLLRRLGRGATADGLFGDLVLEDPRLKSLGWRPSRTLAQEVARAAQTELFSPPSPAFGGRGPG